MLIHYLSFAIRLLSRSRMYAAITIGGLAIALASCILMLLFIRHELGFDAWLPGVDQLYRVHHRLYAPGREPTVAVHALGPIRERLAGDGDLVASARLIPVDRLAIEHDGQVTEEAIVACDPSVFDVLDLPVVRGVRGLAEPTSALVTESYAHSYFGAADPIGRTLTIRGVRPTVIRIVGVLRDLPAQTHLVLGIVTRIDVFDDPDWHERLASWHNVVAYTYLKLRPGADPARIEQRINALLTSEVPDIQSGKTRLAGRDLFRAFVVPIRELHFDEPSEDSEMRPPGDLTTIWAIAGVGALLLLIAIGNFLNLATARAGRRAREIAIRKASGAEPRDIIIQYLGEAVLTVALALVLALVIVELALPWFEQLSGRPLALPYDPTLLGSIVGAAVALGLISGIYPAIVLSRYQPAVVMNQNQTSVAGGSGRLRSVLVFAQFTAAIVLAIATAVVYRQARYAADADLGFTKRDRLVVHTSDIPRVRRASWAEQLRRIPGVEAVALGSSSPGDGHSLNTVIEVPGDPEHSGMLRSIFVDSDYFATLGVTPLAGRVFSREVATDDFSNLASPPNRESGMILNVSAVRRLGLGSPEQAVGRSLQMALFDGTPAPFRVIGVVPDMRFDPVHRAVEPSVFLWNVNWFSESIVALAPGRAAAVQSEVERLWRAAFPDRQLHAELIEAAIDAQYQNERRLAAILTAAALLALVVACLGLYGLSSFITESRRKEIAIRKILGASTTDVIQVLAQQLARPVALACVVAAPIAYLASERWLGRFAYRISVGLGWIALAIVAALAIAAATVAIQALRSARATPVDALRAS